MTSHEIRQQFLRFFESAPRNHKIIPSSSLVPENDPTVLFNTAGMQPLVPYLMGAPHPMGTRLANSQKCLRTDDIDDVGDNTHATFFEMLGNWSLGDYFKKEAITWSYQFLTLPKAKGGLGLDPKRLYVTVFEGDTNAPRDDEAFETWKSVGVPAHRIYWKGADTNWWPAVKGKDTWTGPTGPCTEMFYDITVDGLGDLTKEEYMKADDEQKVVEIWNDVFMEYEKNSGKIVAKLKSKNVDTGSGLERVTTVVQGKSSIFDTDIFTPIIAKIRELSATTDTKSERVIADHIRASVFLISDGVSPGSSDQSYILRRLLRRSVRYMDKLKMQSGTLSEIAKLIIEIYSPAYANIGQKSEEIINEIKAEEAKFRNTLSNGLKEFNKVADNGKEITGEQAFNLLQSFGFPLEITIELAKEKGIKVDTDSYAKEFKKHQELSRIGAEEKFKGGLKDNSDMSVRYHTATHLLHQALRKILGEHVMQKGSNITPERLRFDFSHQAKLTDDEKQKVEDEINRVISANLPVRMIVLPKQQAIDSGALHFFGDKYGDNVSVYYIGGDENNPSSAYSKEFCGGPHVKSTGDIGKFKIQKEEAVSAGVRRIKAIVE